MVHATNLRAFRDGDVGEPFLRLYLHLVAVEIRLKDLSPTGLPGHDIERLVKGVLPNPPPGLTAQLLNVARALGNLYCTSRQGTRVPIDATKYPDLRYLRHEADFAGDSSPAAVQSALDATRQLITELKMAGVTL